VKLRSTTVSTKFIAALAVITLVVASAILIALVTFDQMQEDYDAVSHQALPMLAITSRLSGTTNAVAAAAPALVQTENEFSRRAIGDRVNDQLSALDRSIDELRSLGLGGTGRDSNILNAVDERRAALDANLEQLNAVVKRRIEIKSRIDRVIARTLAVGELFRGIEARADQMAAVPVGWLIEADWALTSLLSLPVAQSTSRIESLKREFDKHAQIALRRYSHRVGQAPLPREVSDANAQFVALTRDAVEIFSHRREILTLERRQRGLLADGARLSSRLSSAVADLFFHVQSKAEARNRGIARLEQESSAILIGALAACLVLVGAMYIYLRGNVLRRLSSLKTAMFSVVEGGRTTIEVEGRDEIADMGRTFQFMIGAISEREQRLTEARNQALQLANDADSANRAKSMFLANMSHELRTPLNAIIGFAEMIQLVRSNPDKDQEYARYISESGKHLLAVINDVLDFSKIEAGKREMERKQIALEGLLRSVIPMIEFQLNEKNQRLDSHFQGDVTIFGDEQALKQVLLNLLSNAVKFSHDGTAISVLGYPEDDGSYIVEVRDRGVGIPASQLTEILKPFHQERNEYQADGSGTGLGLSIADNLMRMHGGEISIESAVGRGTTARLIFPPDIILESSPATGASGASTGKIVNLRPASRG